MIGLFGCCRFDSASLTDADGLGAPSALTHLGPGVSFSSRRARAVVYGASRPTRGEEASWGWAAVRGRIDEGAQELLDFRRLSRAPERLGSLIGDFTLAVWDEDRRELLLARDFPGAFPLYFHWSQGRVLFASEVKALLAEDGVSPALNWGAVADWFLPVSLGALEGGDETLFRDVLEVRPGEAVLVTARGVRRVEFARLPLSSKAGTRSFGEAVEAFSDRLGRAIRRRLSPNAAVSVSGGLDSSSLYALASASASPLGLTLTGIGDADESRYIEALESRFGRPIERIAIDERSAAHDFDASLWHGEFPMLDFLGHAQSALYGAAVAKGASVVLSGHGADETLFTSSYLEDLVLGGRLREAVGHAREWGRWLQPADRAWRIQKACVGGLRARLPVSAARALKWGRVRRCLRRGSAWPEELVRLAHHRAAPVARFPWPAPAYRREILVAVLGRAQRQTRAWLQKTAARHRVACTFPFLDRQVVELLWEIPGDVVSWKGVPRALLRESMKGVLPEPIRERAWKSDYLACAERALAEGLPDLEAYAASGAFARSFGLRDAKAAAPSSVAEWMDLCALEGWCRLFAVREATSPSGR